MDAHHCCEQGGQRAKLDPHLPPPGLAHLVQPAAGDGDGRENGGLRGGERSGVPDETRGHGEGGARPGVRESFPEEGSAVSAAGVRNRVTMPWSKVLWVVSGGWS